MRKGNPNNVLSIAKRSTGRVLVAWWTTADARRVAFFWRPLPADPLNTDIFMHSLWNVALGEEPSAYLESMVTLGASQSWSLLFTATRIKSMPVDQAQALCVRYQQGKYVFEDTV